MVSTNEATLAPTAAATDVTLNSTASATSNATTAASISTQAATQSGTADALHTTFVIADVSATPTNSIALLQPLADYLQVKLAPAGITSVTIKVAPDFDTIAAWLKDGEVDMLFQTPYPAILLQNAVGAQPILRRWRDGDAEYYTVIFARADSGIKVLSDLKGKMLAVQDQFSTTAYMLPLSYILDSGIKIVQLTDPTATVPADAVGYTNSNGDDNTLQWVISGKVAAGATDFRSFDKIPAESRTQLVVLAQTEKVPRGLVVVRPGMDSAMLGTLKSVLLAMDSADDGKAVLAKIQKTTKFDELPGGPDAALSRVQALTKLLKEAVNK
jgi:phosphonate transport system substrate-binding protein